MGALSEPHPQALARLDRRRGSREAIVPTCFDVERTTFQLVLEVVAVGVAAFVVVLSLTVLRFLPDRLTSESGQPSSLT